MNDCRFNNFEKKLIQTKYGKEVGIIFEDYVEATLYTYITVYGKPHSVGIDTIDDRDSNKKRSKKTILQIEKFIEEAIGIIRACEQRDEKLKTKE